jgi:hypothetical protein
MVNELGMPHFFLTLIIDEITSSRWNKFNDMEHIVKQIYHNMSWKYCPIEGTTLSHFHVDILCINIY